MLKTAEKMKLDKNKVKSKKGFREYKSKGVVDKNGAKCNMGFGRVTKIYRSGRVGSFSRCVLAHVSRLVSSLIHSLLRCMHEVM